MKSKIKQVLFVSSFFFFFSFFLLFITLPKFLILDQILLKNSIYLMAEGAEEGMFSLRLRKAQIYIRDFKLGEFESLEWSFKAFYFLLSGQCAGGSFQIKLYPNRTVEVNGKNLRCIKKAHIKSIDLSVAKGIRGNLELTNLKVKDFSLDELSLNFKGNVFSGKAKTAGLTFIGDGVISFNEKKPLKSSINGKLVGSGMTMLISGTLENPSLEFGR
ncbi:hypothetical protein [Thermocrinis sp.]